MAPIPLEGLQTPVGNTMSQGTVSLVQDGNRGGSISLAMLIDFIVQRTYHELTVLAELLPRKTDMERKIEIYNFSARTRQLFVRLLALVKWASSASKVEKSARIMAFLDKQSLLFVDTADRLARMARETLVHARLPNFHIPAAVEVLTTGSYNRLPACIREKIVPPDPITAAEKRETLLRLNQVIQHRLVTGNLLPQMRNLKIDLGRVTFHVDNEFEVSLTVMGDGPNIPWRLLDVNILVEDKETGDGKPLVHSLQVLYIHKVLQTRIADCPNPLNEVYSFLHFFCQSLQLEVLYTQTLKLMRDRLDNHIHVDEYTPGKSVTISYWRELTNKDPRSELGYKLTVQVDAHDPARPLSVVHIPMLANKEFEQAADQAIRSDLLSMERLLVHTIYVRTKNRLSELKVELQTMFKSVECTLQGSPAILSVAILQPCLRAEQLLITVDTHSGMFLSHVPQYDAPIMGEVNVALNNDRSRLPNLITELRYWLTQRRCEKTLQHLPASCHERLPLLYHTDHPITRISRHRMCVQMHRHPSIILIVALQEKEANPCEVECSFYLATVKHSSIEDNPNDETIETEIPKMYFRVLTLQEFDNFVLTHGPYTTITGEDTELFPDTCVPGSKRKSISGSSKDSLSSPRKTRYPAYYIPELAHVVAMCDERLPFVCLSQELSKREIHHQGIQVESNAVAIALQILQLPCPNGDLAKSEAWKALQKRLLSITIRMQGKNATRSWMLEFVFYSSPLASKDPKEQGQRRPIYFQYDLGTVELISRTVDAIINNWTQIVHLYALVYDFAEYYYKKDQYNFSNIISIISFNYSKLILGYGVDKGSIVTVDWNPQDHQFRLAFAANQGSVNAHLIMREQLEVFLNQSKNLAQLAFMLHETYEPLVSVNKLSTLPQLGAHAGRPQIPAQTFTMMPQSATMIRIAYQGMYCLELRLLGGGLVSLRDGAYSRFDRVNVVEEFTPIQGLKTFLSKYADESAISRRRSQSEDDNPPSPITMGMDNCGSSGGGYIGGGPHRGGPQSPARDALRFHPPLTPPSGSNPHTPASPLTNIGQTSTHTNFGSSPATSFNLASPPSLPSNINPSPLPHMPHPSPGGVANSPLNSLHVPSPAGMMPSASPGPSMPGHSPASSFMQTSHADGSPFPSSQSLASPAASNWPGSPSVPRPSPARPGQSPLGHTNIHSPQAGDHKSSCVSGSHSSRILPARPWAAAVPTLLTNEALDQLFRPTPHPANIPGPEMPAIERFLGCVYMRKQFQRYVHQEGTVVANNEPGVVQFKTELLQCRVGLNPQHLQSLHLKVTPTPEHKDNWTAEELQIVEKFFDTKPAAPPFKPNSLYGFGCSLNVPFNVLKDFIQIMRLELMPNLIQQQGFKWSVQWALRIPPSATPIAPCGMAGVLVARNKILFFLQITRVMHQPYPPNLEPPSLVLPFVYDANTNVTQLAEKREAPGAGVPLGAARRDQMAATSALIAASLHLKRFSEFNFNSNECSLFPAVRDLLTNLVLPSEAAGPPQVMQGAGQQVGPPQPVGVGPSPSGGPAQTQMGSGMQMNSPMQAAPGGPGQPGYGMPPIGMMGPGPQ